MFKNNTRIKKYRFYRLINSDIFDLFKNINFNRKIIKINKKKNNYSKVFKKDKNLTVYEYYSKKRKRKILIYVLLLLVFIGILIGVSLICVRLLNG